MVDLGKKQKVIMLVVGMLVLGIVALYFWTKQEPEEDFISAIEEKQEEKQEQEEEEMIIIHIAGQVKQEGILHLKEGARIADAIEAAGGTKEEVDLSEVNLAYVLADGQKVYIPSIYDKKEEIEENGYITEENGENIIVNNISVKNQGKGGSNMVNINTATQTELETLAGIGASTALKIIEYRNENGKFNTIEDIKNVRGIGESKYENIKNNITVK